MFKRLTAIWIQLITTCSYVRLPFVVSWSPRENSADHHELRFSGHHVLGYFSHHVLGYFCQQVHYLSCDVCLRHHVHLESADHHVRIRLIPTCSDILVSWSLISAVMFACGKERACSAWLTDKDFLKIICKQIFIVSCYIQVHFYLYIYTLVFLYSRFIISVLYLYFLIFR